MSNNYLPTSYQEFIHLSRYSRWLPEKERRETWDETVARYFDFFTEHLKELHNYKLTKALRDELEEAVLSKTLLMNTSWKCVGLCGQTLSWSHFFMAKSKTRSGGKTLRHESGDQESYASVPNATRPQRTQSRSGK